MGRDLASYTHVDALHQAYFVAVLVLAGIGCPVNPGNPYIGSRTQHGFETFGSPQAGPVDAVGTIPEMATRALKAAWFHKWIVNLRQRPEEVAALLQATHHPPAPDATGGRQLHPDLLNSAALPIIHSQYRSYLLPQVFPEGAPTHPCYPTGHGTVGGACISAIKFFFDGSQRIQPLLQAAGSDVMVPSEDGLSLVPYTGSDARQPHRQRRTLQAGLEHHLRSWHPRRHPLPQLQPITRWCWASRWESASCRTVQSPMPSRSPSTSRSSMERRRPSATNTKLQVLSSSHGRPDFGPPVL